MKRSSIIIVAGCLTALLLGLALAYPLLITNIPVTIKNGLGLQVVYAYFGTPNFDPNTVGLYRNYTNPQQFLTNSNEGQIIGNVAYNTSVISYFIILNVTNSANQLARINNIETLMGPVHFRNPWRSSRSVKSYPK